MELKKKDRIVHNISEFTKVLLKDLNECSQPVWFRGQSSKSWKLEPSIVRKRVDTPEMTIIKKFKQNANMLINPRPNDLIDWLLIMQHHGAPTRLLDWTESPLVASYFAADPVTAPEVDKEGVIWALFPIELNKIANIKPDYEYDIPSFAEDKLTGNYIPENFAAETTSKLYPLAIIAPRNSSRMQVQLSVFTINHRNNTPIEEIGDKKHVWRYIIPEECKTTFKKELICLGLSKFQLFPELQTIGDLLK
jgi:hypothetical protein